jgi:hypothetical protein
MTQQFIDTLVARFGTAVWDQYNIVRWMWYDTVRVPTAGTTQLSFFKVPAGGVDPNLTGAKTAEQTNAPKSASFGQNFFALTAIRTYVGFSPKVRQPSAIAASTRAVNRGYSGINAGSMALLFNLMQRGVLELKFGDKSYLTIDQPFVNCPSGAGIDILSIGADYPATNVATGPNKYTDLWVQQDTDPRFIWVASPPIVIEPEQLISLDINFLTASSPAFTNSFLVDDTPTYSTPNVDALVALDGYLIRPRQ